MAIDLSSKFGSAMDFLEKRMQKHRPRKDGTPAIGHSIRVAQLIAEKNLSPFTIVIALLHDLIEDTHTTLDEIKQFFGDNVARAVSALSEDKSKSGRKRDDDLLRRVVLYGQDTVAVKLADNADNIRTIEFFKPQRRKSYLRYARRIQDMGCRMFGPNHSLTTHHLGELKAAQLKVELLPD